MRQFVLPDLGEGLEEAEIVNWHVNEGDHVVTDQPLVSVETDKAVVEVPSPSSGRILHLFGAKGDVVKVGGPLVEFAEGPEQDTGTIVGELGISEPPAAASACWNDAALAAADIDAGAVRFSIGLEDAADLIADVTKALDGLESGDPARGSP